MKKKERQLKVLLQQAQADKPNADFTDKLIKQLQETTAQESALHTLLTTLPRNTPSPGFTAATLRKINAPQQQPSLISSKGWWAIAIVIILPISILWVSGYHQSSSATQPVSKPSFSLFQFLSGEYSVLTFTLIAVALLLCIDYLLKNRKQLV